MSDLGMSMTTRHPTQQADDFNCGWSVVPLLTALSIRSAPEVRAQSAEPGRAADALAANPGADGAERTLASATISGRTA